MKYVKFRTENRKAYIRLNRPQKRNALNQELVAELKTAIREAENQADIKIIILEAEGKAFCAGADLAYLRQLQNNSYEENLEDSQNLRQLYEGIYRSPKIVIAKLEGHAIAGGAGLATVCDFIFSVPDAKYGYTETAIGFVPAIVAVFLIRKIGEAKAKELLLAGDIISAEQAKDAGIINFISSAENIGKDVNDFADKLIKKTSADSLQLSKKLIAEIQSKKIEPALDFAAQMNARSRNTPDCKRGIAAFLNKEKISW